jgi:Flp pilus assembly pilin Flp
MSWKTESGATMVEFALVLIVFLTFLLGIIDFSRMLWTWNAATEATRWGARSAVVCDKGAPVVLANMRKFLPQLELDNLRIEWYDQHGESGTNCVAFADIENDPKANICAAVTVQIKENLKYHWISPIGSGMSRVFDMPRFSTHLPREAMGRDTNSGTVCNDKVPKPGE